MVFSRIIGCFNYFDPMLLLILDLVWPLYDDQIHYVCYVMT